MENYDKYIINNMIIHYSGLLKAETKDLGANFMAKSIFMDVDTSHDGILQQEEIDIAKPNLATFIKKVLAKDDFYARLHFGKEYTENLKQVDLTSDKSAGEQIIENNLNKAVNLIFNYADNHPKNKIIQQYAEKLKEIIANNNLKLTDINSSGVSGRANKLDNGQDEILIDNHDSMSNLSVDYLLNTLLHELRHTMETDTINSKAEEVEAELMARDLQEKITGNKTYKVSIEEFAKSYSGYAEASPGTYSIPQNAGIAVWYKPIDVKMTDNNELIIKSDIQESMGNMYIEDHVQFGNDKDEKGNPYPVSAKCIIKDKDGNILQELDYGNYDTKAKKFNYFKIHMKQIKMKTEKNPYGFLG